MSISFALSLAKKYANGGRVQPMTFHGIPISIENKKGTIREGINSDGKSWSNRMAADYGYIKRTLGKDGDQVDVFVGPNKNSNKVFIIDQLHHSKVRFDEHKCLVGFNDKKQALTAYHKSYGRKYGAHHSVGGVTEMSLDAFKEWLKGGGGKKPVSPDVPKYQFGGVVEGAKKVGSAIYEGVKDWASTPGEIAKQETPELPQTGELTEEDEYLRRAAIAAQQERAAHWGGESALNLYGTSAPFRMPRRATAPTTAVVEPEAVDVGRRQVLGGLGAAAAAATMPKSVTRFFEHPVVESAAGKSAQAIKYLNPMRFAHLPEWEVFTPRTFMSLMARNMGPHFTPASAANILGKYIPDSWSVIAHDSPIPRNAVSDAINDWVATAERMGTPVQALAEKGPKASWSQDILDFKKHLEKIKPELNIGEAAQGGFPDYLAQGKQAYHPPFQEGGAVKYTEPTEEDPTRYPYYESDPGPGTTPPIMDAPGVGPVPTTIPTEFPALPTDTRPMEPTLQEAQMGQQELPEDLAVNDAGQVFHKKTGKVISVAPRPSVLPLYRTSEGQIAPAMPKALDIIGSMGAGWSVPTRGAEAILGAGFVKGVKEPQKYGFKGDPFKEKTVSGFELDPAEVKASKQITGTLGTSKGGTFTGFSDGINRYIKEAKSLDHAREEVLASKLYELAGVPAAKMQVTTLKGKPAISSEIISGAQQLSKFEPYQYPNIKGIHEHHPADAWLANWDWGGFGPENYLGNLLVDAQNDVHRIDFGGALSRRGLGGSKGDLFTDTVGELQTLKQKQPSLLKDATLDPNNPTANRIANITDKQISDLVYKSQIANPEKMIDKLVARRDDLAKQYGITKKKPPTPEGAGFAPEDEAALEQVLKEQGIGTPKARPYPKAIAESLLKDHAYPEFPGEFDNEGIADALYRMAERGHPGLVDDVYKHLPHDIQEDVNALLSQHIEIKGDPWAEPKPAPKKGAPSVDEAATAVADQIVNTHEGDAFSVAQHLWDLAAKNPKTANAVLAKIPEFLQSKVHSEIEQLEKFHGFSNFGEGKPIPFEQSNKFMTEPGSQFTAENLKKAQMKDEALQSPALKPMNINKKHSTDAVVGSLKMFNYSQITPKNMTAKQATNIVNMLKVKTPVELAKALTNERTSIDQLKNVYSWLPEHMHKKIDAEMAKVNKDKIDQIVNNDFEAAQAEYLKKQQDQSAKEAAIASGVPFEPAKPGVISNKYSSAIRTIPDWRFYDPGASKSIKRLTPLSFPKVTMQHLLDNGWNPSFSFWHGGTKKGYYPETLDPRTITEPVLHYPERALFLSNKYDIAGKYVAGVPTAHWPQVSAGTHKPDPRIKEFVTRAPKAGRVDWREIAHSDEWDNTTMYRLLESGHDKNYHVLVIDNMHDMGGYQTQYAFLRTEGLRAPEAEFDPKKMHLRFPFAGLVGGGLFSYGMLRGQEDGEQKFARGGSVKSTKSEANYRLGTKKEKCAICTMFRSPDSCTAVQGSIRPQDTCDYFESSKRKNSMPLKKGSSQSTISSNIREFHTGDTYAKTKAKFGKAKADRQAVAVAMSTARKYGKKKQSGGEVDSIGMSSLETKRHGMLHSSIPGRTDKLPLDVPAGAYVLPADIPSALGQGNTLAGDEILGKMFKTGPFGTKIPKIKRAGPRKPRLSLRPRPVSMRLPRLRQEGGEVEEGGEENVPIIAAGGEFIVAPEVVKDIGHGDLKAGHNVLDKFVLQVRKHHIDTLKKLKPPKQ